MFAKFIRLFAILAVIVPSLLVATLALAAETPAAQRPTFTVTVGSAFARSVPNLSTRWATSVFAGQTFSLRARTADSRWLELDSPDTATDVWVLANWGLVTGGLDQVPVIAVPGGAVAVPGGAVAVPGGAMAMPSSGVGNSAAPATGPTPSAGKGESQPRPASAGAVAAALANDAILPQVSDRAREIYRLGLALGNNPQAFSKVGDCLSVPPFFLAGFDNARNYRLGSQYASLQDTINHFAGSFARPSQAARIGFTTGAVLDPVWADGHACQRGESPLACEYRLTRPSLAFISLGTNGDWLTDADYERGLRQIIDFSVERGVLPILSTKADDLDGGRFNPIVRRLAGEYQLPLWDYRLAVEALPNHGLQADGAHLVWAPSYFDDPSRIWSAWQLRNLTALQALDRVWQGVR
jgi:hypothetical protein